MAASQAGQAAQAPVSPTYRQDVADELLSLSCIYGDDFYLLSSVDLEAQGFDPNDVSTKDKRDSARAAAVEGAAEDLPFDAFLHLKRQVLQICLQTDTAARDVRTVVLKVILPKKYPQMAPKSSIVCCEGLSEDGQTDLKMRMDKLATEHATTNEIVIFNLCNLVTEFLQEYREDAEQEKVRRASGKPESDADPGQQEKTEEEKQRFAAMRKARQELFKADFQLKLLQEAAKFRKLLKKKDQPPAPFQENTSTLSTYRRRVKGLTNNPNPNADSTYLVFEHGTTTYRFRLAQPSDADFERNRTIHIAMEGPTGEMYTLHTWKMSPHLLKQNRSVKQTDLAAKMKDMSENFFPRLVALDHPSLVRYYAINITSTPAIGLNVQALTDWAYGSCLVCHVTENDPADNEILRYYAKGILTALQYLHEKSISHRNLMPLSVFYDYNAKIRVGDFGLAQRVHSCFETGSLSSTSESLWMAKDIGDLGTLLMTLRVASYDKRTHDAQLSAQPADFQDFLKRCRGKTTASALLRHDFLIQKVTTVYKKRVNGDATAASIGQTQTRTQSTTAAVGQAGTRPKYTSTSTGPLTTVSPSMAKKRLSVEHSPIVPTIDAPLKSAAPIKEESPADEGDLIFDSIVPESLSDLNVAPLDGQELTAAADDLSTTVLAEDQSELHVREKRLDTEYSILEHLGKGAFGEVVKVLHNLDGRYYAIKRIPLTSRSQDFNKKITREVQLLSKLNHENVVRYYTCWFELCEEEEGSSSDCTNTAGETPTDMGLSPPTSSMHAAAPKGKGNRKDEPSFHPDILKKIPVAKKSFGGSLYNAAGIGANAWTEPLSKLRYDSKIDWAESTGTGDWGEVSRFHVPGEIQSSSSEEDSSSDEDDDSPPIRHAKFDQSSDIIFGDGEGDEEGDDEQSKSRDIDSRTASSRPSRSKRIRAEAFSVGPGIRMYLTIQMEYCEKSTLKQAIEGGLHREEERLWRLFRGVVMGLDHIHSLSTIHRDLKPANIFIDSRDRVKIGDFGLATTSMFAPVKEGDESAKPVGAVGLGSMLGSGTGLTTHVGTAFYVSPEVKAHQTRKVYGSKVDIYSLGVIFFEMCYKPLPIGMQRVSVLEGLVDGDIYLPDDFDDVVTVAYETKLSLIRSMLSHDPSERPSAACLLRGDYFPPPPMEDAELHKALNDMLAKRDSADYKALLEGVFNDKEETRFREKGRLLHADEAKQEHSSLRCHRFSVACKRALSVFRLHSAVPWDAPALMPYSAEGDVYTDKSSVVLLDSAGRKRRLISDLRVPFAWHMATKSVSYIKRCSMGKTFHQQRRKDLFACAAFEGDRISAQDDDGSSYEMWEAAFDIVEKLEKQKEVKPKTFTDLNLECSTSQELLKTDNNTKESSASAGRDAECTDHSSSTELAGSEIDWCLHQNSRGKAVETTEQWLKAPLGGQNEAMRDMECIWVVEEIAFKFPNLGKQELSTHDKVGDAAPFLFEVSHSRLVTGALKTVGVTADKMTNALDIICSSFESNDEEEILVNLWTSQITEGNQSHAYKLLSALSVRGSSVSEVGDKLFSLGFLKTHGPGFADMAFALAHLREVLFVRPPKIPVEITLGMTLNLMRSSGILFRLILDYKTTGLRQIETGPHETSQNVSHEECGEQLEGCITDFHTPSKKCEERALDDKTDSGETSGCRAKLTFESSSDEPSIGDRNDLQHGGDTAEATGSECGEEKEGGWNVVGNPKKHLVRKEETCTESVLAEYKDFSSYTEGTARKSPRAQKRKNKDNTVILAAGYRYDRMVTHFKKVTHAHAVSTPLLGVGVSLDFDKFLTALEEDVGGYVDVLAFFRVWKDIDIATGFKAATKLREQGIRVDEFYEASSPGVTMSDVKKFCHSNYIWILWCCEEAASSVRNILMFYQRDTDTWEEQEMEANSDMGRTILAHMQRAREEKKGADVEESTGMSRSTDKADLSGQGSPVRCIYLENPDLKPLFGKDRKRAEMEVETSLSEVIAEFRSVIHIDIIIFDLPETAIRCLGAFSEMSLKMDDAEFLEQLNTGLVMIADEVQIEKPYMNKILDVLKGYRHEGRCEVTIFYSYPDKEHFVNLKLDNPSQ